MRMIMRADEAGDREETAAVQDRGAGTRLLHARLKQRRDAIARDPDVAARRLRRRRRRIEDARAPDDQGGIDGRGSRVAHQVAPLAARTSAHAAAAPNVPSAQRRDPFA
jgi:hypothetical protein